MAQPMEIKPGKEMTTERKNAADQIARSIFELLGIAYQPKYEKDRRHHGVEGVAYIINTRVLKGQSINLSLAVNSERVSLSIYFNGRRSDQLFNWFLDGMPEALIYTRNRPSDRNKQGYLFQHRENGNWIDDQAKTNELIQKFWEPTTALASHLEKKGLFDEAILSDEELEKLAFPDKRPGRLAGPSDHTRNSDEEVMEDFQREIKSLLEFNFQVILTGAPGTGETYTAREVAKVMVGAMVPQNATKGEQEEAKKTEEERIKSVQFHPGYDYSDFVIGMKPVLIYGGKEVFRDAVGLYTKKDESKEEYDTANIAQRLAEGAETKVSYRWKDGVFKKFADTAKGDLDHKYVFLIDEINRADLSRVFGELFSLLEEEYRYFIDDDGNPHNEKGITLPNGYPFVIPKNLYIIGTMNDIDRSVESMDFALRRRFAWYEVTAEESEGILDATDKNGIRKVSQTDSGLLKSAMGQLNAIIGGEKFKVADENGKQHDCELRLGIEYQLGGAIFAKLEKYVKRDSDGKPQDADKGGEGAFEKLWENHIENILKEYLRGRSNRKELLRGLKQVFDDAINGVDKKKKTGQNGDVVIEDTNQVTDSKSQN